MTKAELLAAVLEAPDDDGPRLVYSDWLRQRSSKAQRARGEFIQIQCALARMPDEPSPERTALVRREAALLAEYELKWIDAAIPKQMRRRRRWDSMNIEWSFERGFVADYTPKQRSDEVVPYLKQIFARIPLVNLHVWVFRDELDKLLAAPNLEKIAKLTISFSGEGTKAPPKLLFATKRFPSLVDLRFDWSSSGSPPPLAELLAAPLAANVERLRVHWYQDAEEQQDLTEVVKTIARSSLRECLTTLALANQIGGGGFDAVAKTKWPRLRRIDLERDDAGAATLPIAKLTALESVHLKNALGRPTPVKQQDAITLVRVLTKLASLAIEGQHDLEIDRLVARPELERLRSLSLRESSVGDAGALAIANATHLKLRELNLAHNRITSKGATALANAAHLASLRRLDLSHNRKLGPAAFTKSPHVEGLQRLDLRASIALNAAANALRERLGGAVLVAEDDDPTTRRKR